MTVCINHNHHSLHAGKNTVFCPACGLRVQHRHPPAPIDLPSSIYHAAAYGPSKYYGEEGKVIYDCVASTSGTLAFCREVAARVTFTSGYRVGISSEKRIQEQSIPFMGNYGPDEMWMNGTQIYSFIKE